MLIPTSGLPAECYHSNYRSPLDKANKAREEDLESISSSNYLALFDECIDVNGAGLRSNTITPQASLERFASVAVLGREESRSSIARRLSSMRQNSLGNITNGPSRTPSLVTPLDGSKKPYIKVNEDLPAAREHETETMSSTVPQFSKGEATVSPSKKSLGLPKSLNRSWAWSQDISLACKAVPNGTHKARCVVPSCTAVYSTDTRSFIEHICEAHSDDLPTLAFKLKAIQGHSSRAPYRPRVSCPARGCTSRVYASGLCTHINMVHHKIPNFMCLICGQYHHSGSKKSFLKFHVVECSRVHQLAAGSSAVAAVQTSAT